MLNQIKRWLDPPHFEGEEEKTTQTRISNSLIIYLGAALLVVIFILIPLFANQKIGSWIISITMFFVLVIGRNLLFKGNYRQGTLLIFSVIYLCIFALLILSGGSSSTAMFYFATVVLIAGFFLDKRVANGLTIATFLVAVGFSFLQDWGLVALPEVFYFNSVFSWIVTGIGLLIMIRARELFVGNLENALAWARLENVARQQAEEGAKSSLSLLQASLEATADGILVVNSAGNFTQWNHKFSEMWKLHKEILGTQDDATLIGQILSQLSDPQQFTDKVRYLQAQPAESSIDQIELLDGRVIELYSQPQRMDSMIVGRVWSFQDVTERKRMMESLAASEMQYRLLANNVPDIIYSLDSAGNIVTINSLAFERYGYREQDAIGKPFLNFIHPEDREIVISSFIKAAKEQRKLTRDLQFRIVAENGFIYWFELNSRADFDQNGYYLGENGVLRDVTERKQAEQKLDEAQAITDAIVNSTLDLIWSVDPENFGLLMFNSGLSNYFLKERGITIQVGMSPEDLFPAGEFVEKWYGFYQRALKEGSYNLVYSTFSGTLTLELTFNLLKRDGKVFGISVFGKDITEQKKAERRLMENLDELTRWYGATLDREGRVLELKSEVNELLVENGKPIRYTSVED